MASRTAALCPLSRATSQYSATINADARAHPLIKPPVPVPPAQALNVHNHYVF
ncbi:MAG: hypothetical protein IT497_08360 [Ottowia sp.]|nr:hypothetical protein [Ottowia sp.]